MHDVPNCSIGAVYLSILNLPRHLFYKRSWTTLCMLLPGPKLPSNRAFRTMLKPLIVDLLDLQKGMFYFVAGRERPEPVYLQVLYAACDLPASRKVTGSTWYMSNHPCSLCRITKEDLQRRQGYDRRSEVTAAMPLEPADQQESRALKPPGPTLKGSGIRVPIVGDLLRRNTVFMRVLSLGSLTSTRLHLVQSTPCTTHHWVSLSMRCGLTHIRNDHAPRSLDCQV